MRAMRGLGRRPSAAVLVAAGFLTLVALGSRLHNSLAYPPDWGFDASFNWRYILRLSEDRALPSPEVGWSTADPPLFFATAAVVWSAFDRNVSVVPWLNTALGLALVALAASFVRKIDPEHPERALLAGGLLLYLPAHVHMSVMVNEEMMAALFGSAAVFLLALERPEAKSWRRPAAVGFGAGLATLSKLTGVLSVVVALCTYAWRGAAAGAGSRAVRAIAIVALVAGLTGGWFYARNVFVYGFAQPSMLPVHERMFDMPPGERSLFDYVYVPVSTFTNPQLLDADLLHSVWGSTFATAWFDGHRFFLPRDDPGVNRLGGLTLMLALLPTLAFAIGIARATRRTLRDPTGPDAPLVLWSALTIAGYAYFTWVNPFFAVVKGTSLLSLALPYSVYASEVLSGWLRRGRLTVIAIGGALAALALCVVLTSTFDLVFEKKEVSGLPWSEVPAATSRE